MMMFCNKETYDWIDTIVKGQKKFNYMIFFCPILGTTKISCYKNWSFFFLRIVVITVKIIKKYKNTFPNDLFSPQQYSKERQKNKEQTKKKNTTEKKYLSWE